MKYCLSYDKKEGKSEEIRKEIIKFLVLDESIIIDSIDSPVETTILFSDDENRYYRLEYWDDKIKETVGDIISYHLCGIARDNGRNVIEATNVVSDNTFEEMMIDFVRSQFKNVPADLRMFSFLSKKGAI